MNAQPSPLTIHPAKAALLAQIRTLESQIAQLTEEKAAAQYQTEQYYRLFRLHLGDLLTQTVDLQRQLALRQANQTGRRSDTEAAQTWQDRFEQTNRAVREAIAHTPTELDETAKYELRRLYRQAVTQAHPDRHINDPERLAKATEFMAQLNDAYQRRDLTTVRTLTQTLADGHLFTSKPDTNLDLEALQQWYQRLVDRQTSLQAELSRMKADESYRLMIEKNDLTLYFSNLRQQMQQQIHQLQQQLHAS